MLLRWIEKTRRKPKVVRNQYAFVGALALTGVIVGIWALFIPTQFAAIDSKYSETDNTSRGLFSGFVDDVKSQFATTFSARQESAESTSEVEEAPVLAPAITLDQETAAKLRTEHEADQKPPGETILIATTTNTAVNENPQSDHINDTNSSE